MIFYGQNKQDKFIYETFFKDKKNGLMIEAGAFDGVTESTFLPKVFCIEYPMTGIDFLNKELSLLNYSFFQTKDNNAYYVLNV